MLTEYLNAALKKAEYKKIDDGTWYSDIPGFTGVWANGDSVEECRNELREVLEEWLILKIRDEDPIPTINGLGIHIKKEAA
jgi:predicted RNase H-like HicB family nuclease